MSEPLTMEDFADCMSTGPSPFEVGYVGDYPQPLEYPCNCFTCRGNPSAVAPEHGDNFHDGEMDWWRCCFCGRYFDLEDMECMSGDTQGCDPCTGAWYESLRAMAAAHDQVPRADSVGDDPLPTAPGTGSLA